jgi:hypothetical protein
VSCLYSIQKKGSKLKLKVIVEVVCWDRTRGNVLFCSVLVRGRWSW